MIESAIESGGNKYAIEKGWKVYKGKSPGKTGFHDRIHFKNGFCFTIEYKATGKTATKKQRKRAYELREAGIVCRCFDDLQNAKEFISMMNALVGEPFMLAKVAYKHLLVDLSSFDA